MIARREFRADLYYRLEVATIRMPPLRERLEDSASLAGHFIAHHNQVFGKRVRFISRRALTLMGVYQWPGNVRELAHTIERATLLCENDRIDACDLRVELVIVKATAQIAALVVRGRAGAGGSDAVQLAPEDQDCARTDARRRDEGGGGGTR